MALGEALRRDLKTSLRMLTRRLEILEGVTPGELVVSDAAFLLKSDTLRSKMGAGCAD